MFLISAPGFGEEPLNGALGGTRTPDTLVRSLILNNRKHYKSTTYDASNHRITA
ncbi:hypothetical protein OQJ02_10575 [Legionella sp. PATHC032]|uniref:hypothetical protein n=1 Tax=Legionella sp. PATHC032 TaxID=2992039 RepID=UPI002244B8A5|nr:hypothetical protein [Legionella sp. PATHC032]MCW8422075.1 hypothetical protein [Legionella sp. PATHC032]